MFKEIYDLLTSIHLNIHFEIASPSSFRRLLLSQLTWLNLLVDIGKVIAYLVPPEHEAAAEIVQMNRLHMIPRPPGLLPIIDKID